MISDRQFTDALTFVRSFKDALECVEQIAERRAAYSHYENLTKTLVQGIDTNQLKFDSHGQVLPGASVADFPLVKQHAYAKTLWTQSPSLSEITLHFFISIICEYGLGSISSRQELVSKLDKGIKELQANDSK